MPPCMTTGKERHGTRSPTTLTTTTYIGGINRKHCLESVCLSQLEDFCEVRAIQYKHFFQTACRPKGLEQLNALLLLYRSTCLQARHPSKQSSSLNPEKLPSPRKLPLQDAQMRHSICCSLSRQQFRPPQRMVCLIHFGILAWCAKT